ncbi:amino acid permease [Nanoarchaeota archaeon]
MYPKEKKGKGLEKVLSFKVILIITVNSIMGTGIFFLPAVGAKHAGPASLISWLILSVIGIYISMCFAELTSMFPKAGGVYEFCKQAYGRFWSFIIGWITFIAGNITIAMLVVGAIHYLIPINMPFVKIGLSLLFILIFNFIAYKGMKTSAVMLVTFGLITMGTLFALIIPGLFKFNASNLTPFMIFPTSAIFITIFLIAETFFGWETSTFLAAETKDGARVMPKALIWGTVIISIICLLFVVTSLGVIPWKEFGETTAPLAALSVVHYGPAAESIFTILVYLSIIGSVAGWVVAAPRLILTMSQDKLFLTQFAKIHPKYRTPYKAIILQTVLTSVLVLIGAGSYNTLLHLLVPMVLILYSAVLLSLVVLRFKMPNVKRYYKVPFGKVGPIITMILAIVLLVFWTRETIGAVRIVKLGLSFILVGLPLYFLLQTYYDKRVIVEVNDGLVYLALLTERISLPMSVRKELIRLLGNVKGKKVMEYGCNVGTLTMLLAEEVNKRGRVYATDVSKYALEITKKRAHRRNHKHVEIMLHEQNEVHKKVPKIDAVVSAGVIGSIQKVEHVLREINRRLTKGSRIVFLDYDKFFDVIPNIEWLSKDKEIKKMFNKCGFEVKVDRKQGLAWQYIYIYGKKIRSK